MEIFNVGNFKNYKKKTSGVDQILVKVDSELMNKFVCLFWSTNSVTLYITLFLIIFFCPILYRDERIHDVYRVKARWADAREVYRQYAE